MRWLFPLSVSFSRTKNTESDNSAKHSCEPFNFSTPATADVAFDFLTAMKIQLVRASLDVKFRYDHTRDLKCDKFKM